MATFDDDVNYLQSHEIPGLFNELMGALLAAKPNQPVSFLSQKLVCWVFGAWKFGVFRLPFPPALFLIV